MPGDSKGFDLCSGHANLVMTVVVYLPFKGRARVGMGLNGRAEAIWCYPIPHPTSPLKGEEKSAALGLTVYWRL